MWIVGAGRVCGRIRNDFEGVLGVSRRLGFGRIGGGIEGLGGGLGGRGGLGAGRIWLSTEGRRQLLPRGWSRQSSRNPALKRQENISETLQLRRCFRWFQNECDI